MLSATNFHGKVPGLQNIFRIKVFLPLGGTGVRQLTRDRLGDPQALRYPISYSGLEDPKRTCWWCTASVCVAVVHNWEISG